MDEHDANVVVATTMPLSAQARADLSRMLGDGYIVLDIKEAPTTANIVLTTVVSARTLGSLRGLFPDARILLTEFDDHDRGIQYPGPITRALEGGPDGYYVAHGLEALPAIVENESRLQLAGSTRPSPPMIDTGPREPVERRAVLWPPVESGHGSIVWTQGTDAADGLTLDLKFLDDAVAGLLRTNEPRATGLWASLVAETAVHLARTTDTDILVDVTGLSPATLAQLEVHVSSERINHGSRPAPEEA
ncbi:hypothetical protein OWR29_03530 [Actinoplanes sp. Pm04-4]|uniref:Uncharacterized protein n=1 Tax=Paractinoplanes pyxinae TaxID=2997416 RepID=A0ABT4AUG9_9ACTN|nr:hypothetical protein [Actinoplanes pyxinae]MCY1137055.1 hypothetical protein [Actinoplanes pyxinae]